FQAEDGIRDRNVTGVQTCALPISILWQWAYNGDFGLVNQTLAMVGIEGPNWLASATWAKPAIIVMAVWKGLGYSMLLYLAAIQRSEERRVGQECRSRMTP